MSACEVLTWIGLGRPLVWGDIHAATDRRLHRWMTTNLRAVEMALAARAAPFPSCAVVRNITDAPEPAWYADRALSPKGPSWLRKIRRRASEYEGRPVSYRELLASVRADIYEHDGDAPDIADAARQVIEALRAEKLTAYGLPSSRNGSARHSTALEPVPLGVLLHPTTTIDLNGQIGTDSEAEMLIWMRRRALTYHDVMFQTSAVLALWPVEASAPRVTLDQLPAAWTLLEAVAWIMLRDPAVVRDTAPETARAGAEIVARYRLPAGTVAATRHTGANVNSVRRLDLHVAWTLDRDPTAEVCASPAAEDALLAALRAGRLTVNASPHPMTPADWRGLRLVEHERDGLRPECIADRAQPWTAVTLDRDAVVAIWPGREEIPMPARPTMATHAPRTDGPAVPVRFSVELLRSEYRIRVARWESAEARYRPPSLQNDLKWAASRFGQEVARPMLREVRKDLAPESWSKPGPRRGAIWPE
jgi:hypothetical protein